MTTKLTAKLAISILILGSLSGFAETPPTKPTDPKAADHGKAKTGATDAPNKPAGTARGAAVAEPKARDFFEVDKPEEKYTDLAKALGSEIAFNWIGLDGRPNGFTVGGEKKVMKDAVSVLESYRKLVLKDCENNDAMKSFVKIMDAYIAEIHRALTVPEEKKASGESVSETRNKEEALKVNAKVIIAFTRELRSFLNKKAEVQKEKKDVFDGQDEILGKAFNWIEGALWDKLQNKPATPEEGKALKDKLIGQDGKSGLEGNFDADKAAEDETTKSIVTAGKTAQEKIKAEEVCKLEEPTPANQPGAGPAGTAGTAGSQTPVDPNAAKIADLEKRLKEAEERARIEKESREAAEKAARSGAGAPFDGQLPEGLQVPGLFDEDLLGKLLQTVDAAGRPNEGARTGGSPSPDNSRSFSIPPLSVGSDQGSQSAPIQPPPMPQYIPPQDMTPMLMALANQQQQNRPVGEVVKPSTTPPPQPPQVIPNPQNAQNAQLSATLAAILSRLGPNGTMQGQTGLAVTNLGALRNRVPRGGSFLRNRTLSRGRSAGTAGTTARGRTRAPARLGR